MPIAKKTTKKPPQHSKSSVPTPSPKKPKILSQIANEVIQVLQGFGPLDFARGGAVFLQDLGILQPFDGYYETPIFLGDAIKEELFPKGVGELKPQYIYLLEELEKHSSLHQDVGALAILLTRLATMSLFQKRAIE